MVVQTLLLFTVEKVARKPFTELLHLPAQLLFVFAYFMSLNLVVLSPYLITSTIQLRRFVDEWFGVELFSMEKFLVCREEFSDRNASSWSPYSLEANVCDIEQRNKQPQLLE